eukprot:3397799-Rhodomonas_salina.2
MLLPVSASNSTSGSGSVPGALSPYAVSLRPEIHKNKSYTSYNITEIFFSALFFRLVPDLALCATATGCPVLTYGSLLVGSGGSGPGSIPLSSYAAATRCPVLTWRMRLLLPGGSGLPYPLQPPSLARDAGGY